MKRRIALVGAGFSGTLTAVHLLEREAPTGSEILLFERTGRFGAGVAYSTPSSRHVLNVPAARMSAFSERPDDFVAFVRARLPAATGEAFVPRHLYGAYLADRLAAAERRGAERGVRLRLFACRVTYLRPNDHDKGFSLASDDGRHLDVSHAVLALGHLAPAPLAPDLVPCHRIIEDPWAPGALGFAADGLVVLVGSGLTMLDVALEVAARAPRAQMLALSRHGFAPLPHLASGAADTARRCAVAAWPRTARGLLRAIRREVREAARDGVEWRDVLAALRSDTPALWQSLPLRERARFLAHVRPFWEIHRHRAAPATHPAVEQLTAGGRLVLRAARILGLRARPDGVELRVRRRGRADGETIQAACVVNCTGLQTDVRRTQDPLVCALRRSGLLRLDPLALGIDTAEDGAVVDANGEPHPRLFAVGPLCKGRVWEATAVPELRAAASRAAKRIGGGA